MASSSLTPEIRIVPCSACGQTINTSMTQCRFCGEPLDAEAAAIAADQFALVNQAISDASFLRIMAGTEMTFFVLRFVPFLAGLGGLGYLVLLLALPGMTARWWLRFGKLSSSDAEFIAARQNSLLYGVGGTVFFVLLWVVVAVLPRLLHAS